MSGDRDPTQPRSRHPRRSTGPVPRRATPTGRRVRDGARTRRDCAWPWRRERRPDRGRTGLAFATRTGGPRWSSGAGAKRQRCGSRGTLSGADTMVAMRLPAPITQSTISLDQFFDRKNQKNLLYRFFRAQQSAQGKCETRGNDRVCGFRRASGEVFGWVWISGPIERSAMQRSQPGQAFRSALGSGTVARVAGAIRCLSRRRPPQEKTASATFRRPRRDVSTSGAEPTEARSP